MDPGVVFTIEPGVYIPSERIGIRIEDDYLMTPYGSRKLSAALPSDPGAIEALMRSAAHLGTPQAKRPSRASAIRSAHVAVHKGLSRR